jgi:hypothetical protein
VKKLIVALLPLFFFQIIHAQNPNCKLRVSLLTCSPGQELYSTFGHSALRIIDSSTYRDVIYNYGTFDFDDPAFYSKFTRGKLLYFVSVDLFENFLKEYQYEERGITEQVLDLSCTEKQKLATALNENAKEENKYYKYDFTIDNCTTRLRDIVFKNANETVNTHDIRPNKNITFRDLIHEYLNKSHQYWSKFGIDVLLGMPLDKTLTNTEAMFLPDYLLKGLDSTTIGNKKLVAEKKEILNAQLQKNSDSLLSPLFVFSFLFLAVLLFSLIKKGDKLLSVFDFILFFSSGILGILLLFMWLGTDHPQCKNNFNLAWAFPFHFIIVFFIYKNWNWLQYYFLINSIVLALLLVSWKWLPQEMNNALIPVVGLLLLRSLGQYRNRQS